MICSFHLTNLQHLTNLLFDESESVYYIFLKNINTDYDIRHNSNLSVSAQRTIGPLQSALRFAHLYISTTNDRAAAIGSQICSFIGTIPELVGSEIDYWGSIGGEYLGLELGSVILIYVVF